VFIVLALVVLILAGGSGASVFAYSSIKYQANQLQAKLTLHLQAGQRELEAAKASLISANSSHDQALIAKASVHFTTAKVEFMLARQIADTSGLMQQLEGVPGVGDMVRSRKVAVDGIADMGVAISDAGLELAKLDGQLIKPAGAEGQQGRTLLSVLKQTNTSLVIVHGYLERAQKAGAQVDLEVLPVAQRGAFVNARATITSALEAVDEFESLVPIITEVLGGNGARTYLIEQVNAAELRPGGGFIGTYSLLRADQGALTLIRSGDAVEFIGKRPVPGQPGYVQPPGPLRESLLQNKSWSFIDSNFFADFPSNAKAGEGFVQPFLKDHIDAIISIDYYTVAKMLELTGPLAIPGYRVTVNSVDFVPLIVEYDLANSPVHKAILSAVAGPLMNRVATLSPDQWPALIAALNELSAARHLQVYFNNADVQKEMDQFGWTGTLNPTGAGDFMTSVESNLGATKANYFVTRHFTVELTRRGAILHHKVTIDLTDDMPYSYRPVEYYSAYLRLYISESASAGSHNLRPAKYPNPAPPAGLVMLDGWVATFHGYGHSAQAVFEYDVPWTGDGRGEARIYWQKQPGTVSDAITVKWNDGAGHGYTVNGNLGQDRVIGLSARGVSLNPGQPARAHLPSLSLG